MSTELIPILALVAMFVIATVLPVNMGVLGFVAAFIVGTLAVGMSTDDIIGGFPSDLFLTLVGITYLFAIAQNNGTVDLMVRGAVKMVGGRVAFMPWVMFGISGLLTAFGALGPAAVAIIAPIALGFAARYKINALLMGMMVIHGAQAGGFSPISVYGVTVNTITDDAGLQDSPITLFLGGRSLIGRQIDPDHLEMSDPDGANSSDSTPVSSSDAAPQATAGGSGTVTKSKAPTPQDMEGTPAARDVTYDQVATLIGLAALAVFALGFDLDVGFIAITVALILALLSPKAQKGAIAQIAWSTVLLIGGVLTFIAVLQEAGTVDYVGNAVAHLGSPLLIALLLCYVGGIVSAFASSTAILGATIPLAVPFLLAGEVGAVGVIVALAVSSTIVDVSPFSTNGALVLANAPQSVDRDRFYKQILKYSALVVAVGPLVAWAVFVLPGWL